MSDAEQRTPAEMTLPPVRLVGQFIKDLSFEVPQAPEIFTVLRQNQPDIPISIDTSMRHLGGATYEVVLSANIEATVAGKTAFILEIAYGCLVEISENQVPSEAVHPLLLMEIPRQMFPFVRQIIAEMTVNGGFPPLMLQMIDFSELYRRKYGMPGQAPEQAPANATIN